MLKESVNRRIHWPRRNSGFTLVEMLVSVALVLLMMSLFATAFVSATQTLSQQRGIAENDQRGRRLTATLRNDLDGRTFRDVLPFRANEDTTQSLYPVSRRSGYFEIDEGNPYDNTDDVLQLTVSVNLPTPDANAIGFIGRTTNPQSPTYNNLTSTSYTVNAGGTAITVPAQFASLIATGSYVWISGSSGAGGITNDGRYLVGTVTPLSGVIPITPTVKPGALLNTSLTSNGSVLLSEFEPDFDDGVPGNSTGMSSFAEVAYFLRNGSLYRRVLLIRDNLSSGNAQPIWSTGTNILWTNNTAGNTQQTNDYPWTIPAGLTPAATTTTFWRDFDYSAFYYPGKNGTLGAGVNFHSASDSLSNSVSGATLVYNDAVTPNISYPLSLGNPALRFGHNATYLNTYFGFPQQATSPVNRFNLQECSHYAFGYPGYIPAAGNPFSLTTLSVDSATGLVTQYEETAAPYYRRGEDILMPNVLSFDVKVWDPVNLQFVDVGDATLPTTSPFSPTPAVRYDAFGNVIGGAFYSTYAAGAYPSTGRYCFDTWHPGVKLGADPYTVQEPPFALATPVTPTQTIPVGYPNAGAMVSQPQPLQAIQISINYRDISSGQIRQVTIVQQLAE